MLKNLSYFMQEVQYVILIKTHPKIAWVNPIRKSVVLYTYSEGLLSALLRIKS